MKDVLWHKQAKLVVSKFPESVRRELGYMIYRLQMGDLLSMPHSKTMREVGNGVNELRVRSSDGQYRVFYYLKSAQGILVFHAFIKKTQKTSKSDIAIGKQRLLELLTEDL